MDKFRKATESLKGNMSDSLGKMFNVAKKVSEKTANVTGTVEKKISKNIPVEKAKQLAKTMQENNNSNSCNAEGKNKPILTPI